MQGYYYENILNGRCMSARYIVTRLMTNIFAYSAYRLICLYLRELKGMCEVINIKNRYYLIK